MSFVRKRNNLDELNNLLKFRLGLKSKHQDRHNHDTESVPKFTAHPQSTAFSKSANLFDLPHKSIIRAFFNAKYIDPKTYSASSLSNDEFSLFKNSTEEVRLTRNDKLKIKMSQ